MGECLISGWSERQFWFSTYRSVFNLVTAKQRKEEEVIKRMSNTTREIELENEGVSELVGLLALSESSIARTSLGKKHFALSVED